LLSLYDILQVKIDRNIHIFLYNIQLGSNTFTNNIQGSHLMLTLFVKLTGECDLLCDPVLYRPCETDHRSHSPRGGEMSVPVQSGQNHAVRPRRGGSHARRCDTNMFIF
jgi:hypothetical protein